jgi:hypothetical protein
MNVTFHIVSAVGAAAVLSATRKNGTSHQPGSSPNLLVLAVGLVAGVLLHGLLDYAPHSYPIKSVADVGLSLGLLTVAFVMVEPSHRLLLGACSLGAVLPDVVDLGPAIINKQLGWSLPVVKLFPWHWRQYSGSIYDGSRKFESVLCHSLVLAGSLSLLYVYRKSFATQKKNDSSCMPSAGGANRG